MIVRHIETGAVLGQLHPDYEGALVRPYLYPTLLILTKAGWRTVRRETVTIEEVK